MDSASILEIAEHGDGEIIEPAKLFHNGERVQQGLRGMLTHTVAGIDDGFAGCFGRDGRRARFGMAQDDHIRITFERADRIRQALAFRHGRIFHLVDRDDRAAQPLHGGGERGRGARGRLIEQVGQDLAFQQVEGADALDHAAHLVRHAEYILQIVATELLDRKNILAIPVGVLVLAERKVGG